MAEYEKCVPEGIRRHFVQAFKGQYGYWFEFDGSVRFDDVQGGGAAPLRLRQDACGMQGDDEARGGGQWQGMNRGRR